MVFAIMPTAMFTFLTPTIVKPASVDFKYAGDIAPLGHFDQLKISNKKNVRYLREAELQHGRTAMLASVAIPTIEMMNPDSLGINYLSKLDFSSQIPFWYVMTILEFYRMYRGWISPFYGETREVFSLDKNYQPGNIFDLNADNISTRKYNTELSNGRLAMLAAAHMIASELVTGETLAQQLSHF